MGVYLLSGKDLYRQEEALKKILKQSGADKDHVITFDASDPKSFSLESAIMECDTFSLFEGGDRKAVIIRDPYFLNASTKEKTPKSKKTAASQDARRERQLSMLEQYLKSPNPDTALVFLCHGFDADTRKKEYKLIEKHHGIITVYKKMFDRDFAVYADNEFRKYGFSLNRAARAEVLNRVDCDTLLLHNAIEKMCLYGKKDPDIEDVMNLVSLNPEMNIFNMSNRFIAGDLAGTAAAMDEMLKHSYDHTQMLTMLASRLRAFYNVRKLYEKGYMDEDIAIRLHQKPYAGKKGLEATRDISSARLLEMLVKLADLEQGIKAGTINTKDGFEQFIYTYGAINAGN